MVTTGPKPDFIEGSVEEYPDRYPSFHQLDISGVYMIHPKSGKWNGSIGFSVTNFYNRDNIIEQVVRQTQTGPLLLNKYSLGFTTNIALTFEW